MIGNIQSKGIRVLQSPTQEDIQGRSQASCGHYTRPHSVQDNILVHAPSGVLSERYMEMKSSCIVEASIAWKACWSEARADSPI